MGVSGKTSKVSSIVAAFCIVVYIAAIAFGAVRIILSIGERQNLAEREFYDLADRATSSSVFLGFMTEAYQATIRDFLGSSQTLLGIIITGSSSDYAFERFPGSGIVWTGESPKFKTGAGLPGEPFFLPLGIEGQRNVTIQAVYGTIDYDLFQRILRNTLLIVLASLVFATLTLFLELAARNRKGGKRQEALSPEIDPVAGAAVESPVIKPKPTARKPEAIITDDTPKGLYTPRGNIGWESYTNDRLSSELHRCASFEQDLTLLAIELKSPGKTSDELYSRFTDEAVNFFTMRDLIFGKGENGAAIIMPNTNLEQGMAKCEEFRSRINAKAPELNSGAVELCIGLSSRSGRLIEADRLIKEAYSALEKAMGDPVSHIVAFKSDPEKYREFIRKNY